MKTYEGTPVFVDFQHLQQHSTVLPFLKEALEAVHAYGRFCKVTVDMGRVIGVSECVETTDSDTIVMRQRPGRPNLTRFVLNRTPQPSSDITVVMVRQGKGYRLLTAYIGNLAEKEPGDPSLTERDRAKSEAFWSCHALVTP